MPPDLRRASRGSLRQGRGQRQVVRSEPTRALSHNALHVDSAISLRLFLSIKWLTVTGFGRYFMTSQQSHGVAVTMPC